MDRKQFREAKSKYLKTLVYELHPDKHDVLDAVFSQGLLPRVVQQFYFDFVLHYPDRHPPALVSLREELLYLEEHGVWKDD